MVAFLLQTTSSEDLCCEGTSWSVGQQDLHKLFFSSGNSSTRRRTHRVAASTSVTFLTIEATTALFNCWFSSTAPGLNVHRYTPLQHFWVLSRRG
jgi:hypothetical protein